MLVVTLRVAWRHFYFGQGSREVHLLRGGPPLSATIWDQRVLGLHSPAQDFCLSQLYGPCSVALEHGPIKV